MDIPASRWYKVIGKRRSRRKYDNRLPKMNHMKRIQQVCDEFRPFPAVRAILVKKPPDDVFKGIIGAYGKISGSMAFIAFIGNSRYAAVEEQIGYLGEGVVLEAEASGLNTCWVGGTFKKELVESMVTLEKYEKVYAVTPIGYAKNSLGIEERLLAGFGFMHRRKSLSELVKGLNKNVWPKWMKESLEAARLAPSAVNRQPWRFLVDQNSITVAVDDKKLRRESVMPKRLCCGIAMLHIEVAARNFGVKGKWEFLKPPGVGRFIIESR